MLWYTFLLLGSVIFLDICLSGDNVVVIAMAAKELPPERRDVAIYFGMGLAAALRIGLAFVATTLLASRWVALVGGVLLLWVAYKLFKDILEDQEADPSTKVAKSIWSAIGIIIAADVSMSLDNVLAVAALARNHIVIMFLGIAISIFVLTFAARLVSGWLTRWPWLNWIGLVLIAWVAVDLISGSYDVAFTLLRS